MVKTVSSKLKQLTKLKQSWRVASLAFLLGDLGALGAVVPKHVDRAFKQGLVDASSDVDENQDLDVGQSVPKSERQTVAVQREKIRSSKMGTSL